MVLKCKEGFDGGLHQRFWLQAYVDAETFIVASLDENAQLYVNETRHLPVFKLRNLNPLTVYILTVISLNSKGQSEPFTIKAKTNKNESDYAGE